MTLADIVGGSRLSRLARGGAARPAAEPEIGRCDLCAASLDANHRHLVNLGQRFQDRTVLCACRACGVLFDRAAAGGYRYRRIPERCRSLASFRLDEATWDALGVPVGLAFFVRDGACDRIVALCPSAIGTTAARADQAAWSRVEADDPVLAELEPGVEALLVNRARGAREHCLAPLGVCYRLAAVVRTQWRGLTGGQEVWTAISRFFETFAGKGGR